MYHNLPPSHYAAKWPTDTIRTAAETTALGLAYYHAPEGPEKEALLLQLLQAFHGYVLKYHQMIRKGYLPQWGGSINEDSRLFLSRFLSKGDEASHTNLFRACRHLHLAFKGQDASEVYDILVLCILKAINKWDPYYTANVRKAIQAIDGPLRKQPNFTAFELSVQCGFDASGIARMLAGKQFLEKIPGAKPGKMGLFRPHPDNWPPPDKFCNTTEPIGLAYFVSRWFRDHLQQYITKQMSQLETGDNIMQLDHRRRKGGDACYSGASNEDSRSDLAIPSLDGNFTSPAGTSWASDITLMSADMDLTGLNLEWVQSSSDPLFSSLTQQERYLLYLLYARELRWKEIADCLQLSVKDAKLLHQNVITRLRENAGSSEDQPTGSQ